MLRIEPELRYDWARIGSGLSQDWANKYLVRDGPGLGKDWARIRPGLRLHGVMIEPIVSMVGW